jgi:ureidoacrylate peracid hydrolase
MSYGPVELDAEPDRIALDLTRSAVIVVDMQNDFGSQGGIFDHAGIDISIIRRAIDLREKSSLRRGTRA